MKKRIANIFFALCILWLIWIGLSYAEVAAKNLDEHPQYCRYNAFVMMVELGDSWRGAQDG